MNPYDSPRYGEATGWSHEVLDAWLHYGPLAAAEGPVDVRGEQARQWITLWNATHPTRARRPGAWRRWLGTFLVRAGTRLHGAPPLTSNAMPAV